MTTLTKAELAQQVADLQAEVARLRTNRNEMTGTLWSNVDRKNQRSPHVTGSALLGGVEYWISGWKLSTEERERINSDNPPLLRLRFEPKEVAA